MISQVCDVSNKDVTTNGKKSGVICENMSHRRVLPHLFRVLPNYHECFYNPTNKKRKSTCLLWSSKCKYSLLAVSLRNGSCYSSVFLSSYRNIYAFNQSANVFAFGLFSKCVYDRVKSGWQTILIWTYQLGSPLCVDLILSRAQEPLIDAKLGVGSLSLAGVVEFAFFSVYGWC